MLQNIQGSSQYAQKNSQEDLQRSQNFDSQNVQLDKNGREIILQPRKVGKDITNIPNIDFSQFAQKKNNHSRNSSSILFNRGSFLNNKGPQGPPQPSDLNKINNLNLDHSQNSSFNQHFEQKNVNTGNNANNNNFIPKSNNYVNINSRMGGKVKNSMTNFNIFVSNNENTQMNPTSRNNTTADTIDLQLQLQTNGSESNLHFNNGNSSIRNNLSFASNLNNNSQMLKNPSLNFISNGSQNIINNNSKLMSRYLTNTTQNSEISIDHSNKENSPPKQREIDGIKITDNLKEMADYLPQIIQHMRKSEEKSLANSKYMEQVQTDINEKMRGILLDWLIDVHVKFKLLPETLFLTVNLIDRYLSIADIPRTKLQLVGVASLFIGCKYEEVYSVPHIKDLVYVCDKAYTKEEIFDMEGDIIQKLHFDLISVSPLRFLEYYSKQAMMEEKNYMLCRYLIEMTLLELRMSKYKPSLIACASIYLVHKIRKNSQPFNEEIMKKNTQYTEAEVRPCAKDLCSLLQSVDKRSSFKSLKRKFSLPQFCEVSKIRIERKQPAQSTTSNSNNNNNEVLKTEENNEFNIKSNSNYDNNILFQQQQVPQKSKENNEIYSTNNQTKYVENNSNVFQQQKTISMHQQIKAQVQQHQQNMFSSGNINSYMNQIQQNFQGIQIDKLMKQKSSNIN